MKAGINLEAYFERITYPGPRTAGLDVLKELHRLHPQTFAFENLNPYLRIPVTLDLETLQKKMIFDGRGGYCFEQNLLFKAVLEELEFEVKGLSARILWNQPEGTITSRGHMLLLIDLDDQKYIADVGFGGLTLTAPLRLEPNREQQTPHESFRLLEKETDEFIMQAKVKEEWKSIYRFDLQEQFQPDFEVTNWYLSNHPESHFVTGLIAARPDKRKRYTLHGNKFSIHRLGGKSEKLEIPTVKELKRILQETFHLQLPDTPDRDAVFSKLFID